MRFNKEEIDFTPWMSAMAEEEEKKEESEENKEEEKDDKKKKKKKKKEKKPEDPEVSGAGKKRKFIIFGGIGTLLLASLAGGAFFAYKTFLAKPEADIPFLPGEEEAAETAEEGAEGEEKKDDKKEGESAEKKEGEEGGEKSEESVAEEGKKDDPAVAEDKKEPVEVPEDPKEFGEVWKLGDLDLNLGNPLENRFLRVGVALEVHGGEEQVESLEKRKAQIQDIVISIVTSKTRLELVTAKGKARLRRDILYKLNEVLDKPISSVYFTQFLIE